MVMPNGTSTKPPRLTLPASWNGIVPVEGPTPRLAYQSPPLATMAGTDANEITLWTKVGSPNRPLTAGTGGLTRISPRLPSRLSSSDVSSPQM